MCSSDLLPGNSAVEPKDQVFFNVSGLESGSHRLEVVNGGNDRTAALGLTHIYTRSSTRVTIPPVTEPPSPTTTTTTGQGSKGKIIGMAVGISVVAILLLLLLAYAIMGLRRRRRQEGVAGGRLGGQQQANGRADVTTEPVPDVRLYLTRSNPY